MTLNYNEQREARRKALRLLEHMDRTEKGLQERLIQGGFSEAAAEDAVAYVKDYGYVNDYRYALNPQQEQTEDFSGAFAEGNQP